MNFLKKVELKKSVHSDAADDIWDSLVYLLPKVRDEIRLLTKNLEKDPTLKAKVIKDYGTGFIDDLGYVAALYNALK